MRTVDANSGGPRRNDGSGAERRQECTPDWRHRLLARYYSAPEHPGRLRIIGMLRRALRVRLVSKRISPGVIMDLDPEDYLQREILVRGSYEGATLRLLDRLLESARGFLDIGAHMGLFTLRAASALAGRGGRVVAVEPTPTHAAMLLRNADRSGLSNIDLICAALSDFRDLAIMASPHEANSGGSRLKEGSIRDLRRIPIRVPVLRSSDILPHITEPALDLVKVDVEGHEFRVLRPLLTEAARLPSNLIIEYIPEVHPEADALSWANGLGYEILDVEGRPISAGQSLPENNLWLRLRGGTDPRAAAG